VVTRNSSSSASARWRSGLRSAPLIDLHIADHADGKPIRTEATEQRPRLWYLREMVYEDVAVDEVRHRLARPAATVLLSLLGQIREKLVAIHTDERALALA
jgi:hypothetical protein